MVVEEGDSALMLLTDTGSTVVCLLEATAVDRPSFVSEEEEVVDLRECNLWARLILPVVVSASIVLNSEWRLWLW